ncbi:MAG TPA: UDP-N-acetylmuramate dehydrogenase [Candidatus Ozemobacteraceae bacterium]|nr:UDP-N-acetylmuramate dehydrogenase [Candidatus Ozemobacteraceae bacterium]
MDGIMKELEQRLMREVPLAPFTTFHIGGPAQLFLEVRTEAELTAAVRLALSKSVPCFLLGGGSNLVVSDQGVEGLVIRNRVCEGNLVDAASGLLTVSSGHPLWDVVQLAQRSGLTGFETLAGIPGTVGGAIYGNAGAYGKCIGDLLASADILDPTTGEVHRVEPSFFEFGYRTSSLKRRPGIILRATFRLTQGDPAAILAQINDILTQRHSKHPPIEVGCAGSFFKNLDPNPGELRRRAAGEVLEKAGAKEMVVGGASVYTKHANFIVNYGKASAADVRTLASLLKRKVQEMFGIELHEEVLYVGR